MQKNERRITDNVPNVNVSSINTRQQKTSSLPSLSLPKGGGAIRGIGEKFEVSPVTGTASLNVPIFTSPGRSGFSPDLALSYNSGAGNGPFGLGWTLSLASITRKTDKGLPKYCEEDNGSDIFILSGAEDLVPVLVKVTGRWQYDTTIRTVDGRNYRIQRYRPRTEGLFARIERWTDVQTGETHWRSISRDNITSLYGTTVESRIADPSHPSHVFSWLICESYDDKGNAILYQYVAEDSTGIDLTQAHEINRNQESRSSNRYIKRIKYCNQTSRLLLPNLSETSWLFETVFDYGEHDKDNPTSNDSGKWLCRNDSFSSYRAGFEVRTYRLCQRILMFHHFPDEEEVGKDCLIRSTDFVYLNICNNPEDFKTGRPVYSLIASTTQNSYRRKPDGSYLKKSLPQLEFEYSKVIISDKIQEINAQSLENLPYGVDGMQYQWADLDGEGVSGILTEQGEAWFYKPNLGGGKFGPLELVSAKSAQSSLASGRSQLMDLAGDGHLDIVELEGPVSGFYERTDEKKWENFTPFTSTPNVPWRDPNLRFIDLTGDGHVDVMITEDAVYTWYPSLAEEGFGPAKRVHQTLNEEKGPHLVFNDGTQSIYLADLSGDGLTDLVRIRNGEVCYWPNLGYGRFGSKVTMDSAPWFDSPDQFDQQRILLTDIDGSGPTDIIYLGQHGISLYFNQSGNSWSEAKVLTHFPKIDNLVSVIAVDLFGRGTPCLVWSSPLPKNEHRAMYYVDTLGDLKPHVLVSVKNNLGAEIRIQYTQSTKFYLGDKVAGKPWITKLPFPVHVVERVETYDHIGRSRFVTRYAYHHGYFDGTEREFRGFGLVEQWDTEEFATLDSGSTFPPANNVEKSSHVPPVLTRTWFHTGAHSYARHISKQFENEYYRGSGMTNFEFEASLLPDTIIPNGLTGQEEIEACRALKGLILRQEIYGLDGSPQSEHPYVVSERTYAIKLLQPSAKDRYSVFFTHPSEKLDYYYERNPTDPRITHALTMEVDEFGNILKSAAISYGRQFINPLLSATDQAKQSQTLVTYSEKGYTNIIDLADAYHTPVECESRTYELTGLTSGTGGRFDLATLKHAVNSAMIIQYEVSPSTGLQKRLIEHLRTQYRKDDLTAPLPLGRIESMVLPYEKYQLAFTTGLISQIYDYRITDTILSNEGGFVHYGGDSNWWIPSGQIFFSPDAMNDSVQELSFARQHFFMPHRFQDAFHHDTVITYDKYTYLLQETRDTLGNIVTTRQDNGLVSLDYRVLQPWMILDPNGNRSAVAFDTLGLVVGTAMMGKVGETLGDSLDDFESDLDDATIASHIQDPFTDPHNILKNASTRLVYDINQYMRSSNLLYPAPNVVYTLSRETHNTDLVTGESTRIQHTFSYSDGFGQEIQKKIQSEPGNVDGVLSTTRWVGDGWTIFNNKGRPVKQYEPFFSNTHHFEFAKVIGVSATLFYDSLGRVVAKLHPNHTFEKMIFDPWRQEVWDVNDLVLYADPRNDPQVGNFFRRLPQAEYMPSWYENRKNGQAGAEEQRTAQKAAIHADTPSVIHLDPLGRTLLTIVDNGNNRKYLTRIDMDIENNQRVVSDALGRKVVVYYYDMAGNRIRQDSMDAGERWILNNVAGKPIYGWNDRGYTVRTVYDGLQRPTDVLLLQETEGQQLIEHTVYGEAQGPKMNHRTRIYQRFDGAGVITNEAYDFKGNLTRSSREFAVEYKATLDWSKSVDLEEETFNTRSVYDALNRPVMIITPDDSIIRPVYNEANLLERIEANLRGTNIPTTFIKNIGYNSKGQREFIEYGNGIRTLFEYDDFTFRLIHLQTLRGNERLQDLLYSYDPVGNITHIQDSADTQNIIYFRNRRVEPSNDFIYDAVYRLIQATGREHLGQTGGMPQSPTLISNNDVPKMNLPHPGNGNAMGTYAEYYDYDPVGNIIKLVHCGTDPSHPGWTRSFVYNERSLIQAELMNNRLSRTSIGPVSENYTYDIHGNVTSMPHLPFMQWNYWDRLQATSKQRINGGMPQTTYYVYDTSGQRVRKVTEREAAIGQSPTRKEERIYINDFEVYRKYSGNGTKVKLERQTLHIMDDTRRIALVETRTHGEDDSQERVIRYQLSNHLGSSSLELDEVGRIISYEEYYPYGSTSYHATQNDIEIPLKRYRYIGKERDKENGFYYCGARYFVPWLTRWTNCDPAGLVDGTNLYGYVQNNPIGYKDENGTQSQQPDEYDQYDILYHPNDVVYRIGEIQKPGDVGNWWAREVRPNRSEWAHPLSEIEQGYISTFTSQSTPSALRMRAPVIASAPTPEESETATRLFGSGTNAVEQYANYENRRRIVAHYVFTHPATVQLQLGIYRLFRDINPIHFAFERGWQVGSGREMFTGREVSRLGAAAEFFVALAAAFVIGRALRSVHPATASSLAQPRQGVITESANYAQKTYRNSFSLDDAPLFTRTTPGPRFSGWTVEQAADYLNRGILTPRQVPVDYIIRDGNMLILNTRSAQALTQANIPRSQWFGINRTGNPAFEARLTGQLSRNRLTSQGTSQVRSAGGGWTHYPH
jgi:RHS repeat-associated protein